MTQQNYKAIFHLILITIIWGATFPLIRNSVAQINPFLFVALRMTIASLCFIPLFRSQLKVFHLSLLFYCFILGILSSASYVTQTIGLQTVASARGAFITGLSVVFIPLIAPIFKLGRLQFIDVLCSLICVVGLYILTGADLDKVTAGDLWILLSAVLFTLYVVCLQRLILQHENFTTTTFYVIVFSIPLPAIFSFHTDIGSIFHPQALFGLLFCAIMATSLVFYWQIQYQRFVSAPQAALIYSLEPVFAGIFGFVINGEPITHTIFIGGSIIIFSLVLPASLHLTKLYLQHRRDKHIHES